jgi:hypothetical protein
MTPRNERRLWVLLPLVLGFLAPIVAMICVAPTPRVFTTARGLFIVLVLLSTSLVPSSVLSAVCAWARRRLPPSRMRCVALTGLAGILIVFIPGYLEIFTSTSSTAILGIFFLAFECFVVLVIALLVGWGISLVLPSEHRKA